MSVLETERLLLCLPSSEDEDFILDLLNSPSWLTFIGDKDVKTKEAATTYIKAMLDSFDQGLGYFMIKLKTGHVIGICGLKKREFLYHPDLGFAVLSQYEGQGYMLEATQSVMKWAKSTLKLDKLTGFTDAKNARSMKLMERLGFKYSRTIKPFKEDVLLYEVDL